MVQGGGGAGGGFVFCGSHYELLYCSTGSCTGSVLYTAYSALDSRTVSAPTLCIFSTQRVDSMGQPGSSVSLVSSLHRMYLCTYTGNARLATMAVCFSDSWNEITSANNVQYSAGTSDPDCSYKTVVPSATECTH
jgi:hypothetical protein